MLRHLPTRPVLLRRVPGGARSSHATASRNRLPPYAVWVLFSIEPKDERRARRIIGTVGEGEFRRAVHEMTRFDTEALSLDDVICVYVLAFEGRVQPPGAGRRAVELYPTLPAAHC